MKRIVIAFFVFILGNSINGQVKQAAVSKQVQPAKTMTAPKLVLSNIKYESNSEALKITEIYRGELTYIKFTYPNGSFRLWNTPDKSFYILDPNTGIKYLARNFNNIKINQSATEIDRLHSFVIGFEKIPDSLNSFELHEGINGNRNQNAYWWLKADLANATVNKVKDFETDFYKLNSFIYSDNTKPQDLNNILFTKVNFTTKQGSGLVIRDICFDKLTYIRFYYPHGNFSIHNTPNKTFFIYDAKTGKKYLAKDFCGITLNQTVSGKRILHQFAIGFDKIPADLDEFEVYEGDDAKQIENSWWLSVSLKDAVLSKPDNYETDFATLNPEVNRTAANRSDISFVPANRIVPMHKNFEKKDVEELLKNAQWNPMQLSEYRSYFEDVIGFNTKFMEYKGNLKNGVAIFRSTGSNDFVVQGDFKDGKLNGYGKVHIVKSAMASKPDILLEGYFTDNKLHGLGEAIRKENFNNKQQRGYFYNGKFIVNDNVGDIDENGRLLILLNNRQCKFYPEIEEVKYGYGMFYSGDRAYGADIAFGNSIFGSQSVTNMMWSGSCLNGFADGYGVIKLVGTSSENFTNTEKQFENEVLYGSFKNGHYNSCKIFNFIDLATGLVTGENAKKWVVFENGVFVGEDLSDVARVNQEFNKKMKRFEDEQKAYSTNYDLIMNKSGVASVYFSNPENISAVISVQDGGNIVFGSDVNSKGYSTTVFDNTGKIINVINDPHDDNGIRLEQYQLPGKVIISYKAFGEIRRVELKIKKGGEYTVNIK